MLAASQKSEILSVFADQQTGLNLISNINRLVRSHPSPTKSWNQFIRIWKSSISSVLFLKQLSENQDHLQLLFTLILKSDYFVDNLVKDPVLFSWLSSSGLLTGPLNPQKMEKDARRAFNSSDEPDTQIKLLKQVHRRYMLVIGSRDVIGVDSVLTTTRLLSDLADIIIQKIGHLTSKKLLGEDHFAGLSIYALGKYGGNELNYSSDIDLMAAIDNHGVIHAKGKNHQKIDLALQWIRQFIQFLSNHDEHGYFYRVDFRLRPEGEYGPLVASTQAMINYYFSRGRNWERQMLLKIRPVYGFQIDHDALLIPLKSFVFNPLRQIDGSHYLHESLNAVHANQNYDTRNIKTSPGSIRSIEFFCQTFQLQLGHRFGELWNGNTLLVLNLLAKANIISPDHLQQLSSAYSFYREIEHHLQFFNNQQTHQLPENPADLTDFSIRFGAKSTQELADKIAQNKATVLSILSHYFPQTVPSGSDRNHEVVAVFQHQSELKPEWTHFLQKYPFKDPKQISTHISRLLSQSSAPGSLISLWFSDVNIASDLFMLLEKAPVLLGKLSAAPEFWESLAINVSPSLFPVQNPHHYQAYGEIYLALRYLKKQISLSDYCKEMSLLYETVLIHYFQSFSHSDPDFAIIGLGKFGSNELSIGSDLDIIAMGSGEKRKSLLPAFAQIRTQLTAYSQFGAHFELDLRLRPEGNQSPLITDRHQLYPYFESRAGYWEFIAYNRSRLVLGEKDFYQQLSRSFLEIFKNRKNLLITEYIPLRERRLQENAFFSSDAKNVKKGPGGILDIESFMYHFMLLHSFGWTMADPLPIMALSDTLAINKNEDLIKEISRIYVQLRTFEIEQKLLDLFKSGIYRSTGNWNSETIHSFTSLSEMMNTASQLIYKYLKEFK